MIREVIIKNFRALKDVRVALRPLTVLVGPNDSGKSSFLDAIGMATRGNFEREDRWRGSASPQISVLTDQGNLFTGSVELFKLPSDGIPMDSQGVAEAPQQVAPPLALNGGNLAAFLDYLLRKDRKRFDQIQAEIRRLAPGFEDVRIWTPSPERRAVSVSIEGGFEIAGQRLSTGVRMLFFFVALAYHPNPPELVLIEEPENGVHPRRLKNIVDLLHSLAQGDLSGQPVQVVLSTHSPYLLDQVRLPQDQVIVFRREPDGSRTASEADQARLKAFLDDFMLGEVWFNQGEEGLLASTK